MSEKSKTKKFKAILKKMDLKLSREDAKRLFQDCHAILKVARHVSHFDLVELVQKSQEEGLEDALQLVMFAKELQEDRKSTRLNSSHSQQSRMPSSA